MSMGPLAAGVPYVGRFGFCPLFEKKMKQIKKLNATFLEMPRQNDMSK